MTATVQPTARAAENAIDRIQRGRVKRWGIRIRVEVSELERDAIGDALGLPGMATLAECRRWIERNGTIALETLTASYADSCERVYR